MDEEGLWATVAAVAAKAVVVADIDGDGEGEERDIDAAQARRCHRSRDLSSWDRLWRVFQIRSSKPILTLR